MVSSSCDAPEKPLRSKKKRVQLRQSGKWKTESFQVAVVAAHCVKKTLIVDRVVFFKLYFSPAHHLFFFSSRCKGNMQQPSQADYCFDAARDEGKAYIGELKEYIDQRSRVSDGSAQPQYIQRKHGNVMRSTCTVDLYAVRLGKTGAREVCVGQGQTASSAKQAAAKAMLERLSSREDAEFITTAPFDSVRNSELDQRHSFSAVRPFAGGVDYSTAHQHTSACLAASSFTHMRCDVERDQRRAILIDRVTCIEEQLAQLKAMIQKEF